MTLTTYRAYTMAEALTALKRDLGPDATILHTRTFRRGGLFGIGCRKIVEITASPRRLEPIVPVSKRPVALLARRTAQAREAYKNESGAQQPTLEGEPLKRRKEALAAAALRRGAEARGGRDAVQTEPQPSTKSEPGRQQCIIIRKPSVPAERSASPPSATDRAASEAQDPVVSVARRFVLSAADAKAPRPPAPAPVLTPPARTIISAARPIADILPAAHEELHAIKGMVSQILQHQATRSRERGLPTPLPEQLFSMYLKLIGQELSEELADGIIDRIRGELSSDELDDEARVRSAAQRHLAALIPIADEPITARSADGRPLTIALIGPTGVGKTTTLAKLAATFKLKHGQRVGLVTSDTYRIAAVEQLRTYANIIGLPLHVVLAPSEMKQACHQLRACDVVLIDTAGRSQRDRGKLDELRPFIEAADPHEVHLVLSSTASERVILEEAAAFSAIRADKVILTKLDEAVSFGMLVNVMRKVGKDLSFITTGQEVPDHIEAGRADRLAELVMGAELSR